MRSLKEQSLENLSFEYQILCSAGLKCGSVKSEGYHWTAAVDSQHLLWIQVMVAYQISIMIHLSAVDLYVEMFLNSRSFINKSLNLLFEKNKLLSVQWLSKV